MVPTFCLPKKVRTLYAPVCGRVHVRGRVSACFREFKIDQNGKSTANV